MGNSLHGFEWIYWERWCLLTTCNWLWNDQFWIVLLVMFHNLLSEKRETSSYSTGNDICVITFLGGLKFFSQHAEDSVQCYFYFLVFLWMSGRWRFCSWGMTRRLKIPHWTFGSTIDKALFPKGKELGIAEPCLLIYSTRL